MGHHYLPMNVVTNRKGQIKAFDLSQANRHDLEPVKGGILNGLAGIVFADSGYVSAQIKQDLMSKDIAFIAKPKAVMADLRWSFDKHWGKLYRQRQVVEGVFFLSEKPLWAAGSVLPKRDKFDGQSACLNLRLQHAAASLIDDFRLVQTKH